MEVDELMQRVPALRQEAASLAKRVNDPYVRYELQVAIWKLKESDAVCFRCGANAQAPYLDQAEQMLAFAMSHLTSVRDGLAATIGSGEEETRHSQKVKR